MYVQHTKCSISGACNGTSICESNLNWVLSRLVMGLEDFHAVVFKCHNNNNITYCDIDMHSMQCGGDSRPTRILACIQYCKERLVVIDVCRYRSLHSLVDPGSVIPSMYLRRVTELVFTWEGR